MTKLNPSIKKTLRIKNKKQNRITIPVAIRFSIEFKINISNWQKLLHIVREEKILDEKLLKILYDNRLKPGMNNKDALPIVTKIAKELMNF
jgi:hypothetical protein